jgi:two-component system OmpR family sensor kinase
LKNIEIQYEGVRDMEVVGDAEGWQIMLRNLLDNAVRYTPENGTVRVTLQAEGNIGVVTIEDSGPGIGEQDRQRVFDRFYRVPGSPPGGSGLGLAIVKAIADRHGASVTLGRAAIGGLSVRIRFAVVPGPGSHQS